MILIVTPSFIFVNPFSCVLLFFVCFIPESPFKIRQYAVILVAINIQISSSPAAASSCLAQG